MEMKMREKKEKKQNHFYNNNRVATIIIYLNGSLGLPFSHQFKVLFCLVLLQAAALQLSCIIHINLNLNCKN
jgi:hypothetical protein